MRSSNPSLREKTFRQLRGLGGDAPMTISGTINKTLILLVFLAATALYTWYQAYQGIDVSSLIIAGAIGAFITAFILTFAPQASPYLGPLYAMLEGLALGGISAYYSMQYSGITTQALLLTFSILLAMLLVYRLGWIKVTAKFRSGVIAASFGVLLVYLFDFVLRLFSMNVPFLHETGWIGIGISLIIIGIAALNLILDFNFIESGAHQQAPKYMEWYAGFSLILTLVWLYLEILRFLSKLNRN
ncbi:hypothetical protein A374_06306 [Fictibacillus macauensis ZFHKF-1]|uniref:Bax inhibitor-1/YccA family protein n=1 Tax=Fictibacillus macauensis ZFHKF-1 TaxID=1196324 RepID=I8AKT3_9BACL|nr:Bax inhibitor-1/YccA family protein [Fictibacillus macauensis]EIT86189.1 hypothetical protein A374_06306 [Fictibacillus macauensis ZFHKF-1]